MTTHLRSSPLAEIVLMKPLNTLEVHVMLETIISISGSSDSSGGSELSGSSSSWVMIPSRSGSMSPPSAELSSTTGTTLALPARVSLASCEK